MDNIEVRHIRRKLESYEYYERKLAQAEEKLNSIQYELNGVHGVAFDKEAATGGYSSGAKSDRFYRLTEQKESLLKEIEQHRKMMDEIESMIYCSKEADLLEEIYIKHKSIKQYAEEHIYALSTVYDKIRSAAREISVKFGE